MSVSLKDLAPKKKHNLIALVQEAGHDVSDWSRLKGHASNNPKYCYEWCYDQKDQDIILNIWHELLQEENGEIIYAGNIRANIPIYKKQKGTLWVKRGTALDNALQKAAIEKLHVRIIIQTGKLATLGTMEVSKTEKRELDSEYWSVRDYDFSTGDFVLVRGGNAKNKFIDQFDLPDLGNEAPEKTKTQSSQFKRDARVRKWVLDRASGNCEYCGQKGFQTPNGIYLETHHIELLSEGGADTIINVIALCPNDHKRAHFSINKEELKDEFLKLINEEKYAAALN